MGRRTNYGFENRPKPPFFAASHNVLIKDEVG
jgi:hypothetical protein